MGGDIHRVMTGSVMRDRIRARTLIELDQNDALQGSRKRQKGERGEGGVLP